MTKLAIAVSLTLFLSCAASSDVAAQTPPGFPRVVEALKTSPGCLGVDTGQTASGRQVIFAWFESKKALVDWYHSDVHQRAMKTAFPEQVFDRQPLPDLPDDTGDHPRDRVGEVRQRARCEAPHGLDWHRALRPVAGRDRGGRTVRARDDQDPRASRADDRHGDAIAALMRFLE